MILARVVANVAVLVLVNEKPVVTAWITDGIQDGRWFYTLFNLSPLYTLFEFQLLINF